MEQKVSKFAFSQHTAKLIIVSVLAIVFGIYSFCSIPGKTAAYQQALDEFAIAREEQVAAINAEFDAYISEGPVSMNRLLWSEVEDKGSYLLSYEEIIGPYASMKSGNTADVLMQSEDCFTMYYYLLSYIDNSGETVYVILESGKAALCSENLSDTLYVKVNMEPDCATLPDAEGNFESSYTLAQKIIPEVKCINLIIEYDDHDDFVFTQETYRTNRIGNSVHDLEPSDQEITNAKRNGKAAFIVAAVLILLTVWDMRGTAKKNANNNKPYGSGPEKKEGRNMDDKGNFTTEVSLELPEWKDEIHPGYSWKFLARGIHAMNSLYVTYLIKQTPGGEWQLVESGGTTHMNGYGITKAIPKSCIHGSMLDLKEMNYSGYGGGFSSFEYILDLKRRVLVHRLRIADPSPKTAGLYPEIECMYDEDAYR